MVLLKWLKFTDSHSCAWRSCKKKQLYRFDFLIENQVPSAFLAVNYYRSSRKHVHTHAHTYNRKIKVKSLAAIKQSCQFSEALWCLGNNLALWGSAGKSTWGRASAPHVVMYHAQRDSVVTRHLLPHLSPGTHWCYRWVGRFPSQHKFPIYAAG